MTRAGISEQDLYFKHRTSPRHGSPPGTWNEESVVAAIKRWADETGGVHKRFGSWEEAIAYALRRASSTDP